MRNYNDEDNKETKSGGFGKKLLIIGAIIVLIVTISLSKYIVDTVEFGTFHIKQAAITGEMSVISEPGMYDQMFGGITVYDQAGMLYFSHEDLDGGDGAETQPLGVTFMGNSTADVSGVLKYRLGTNPTQRLELHRMYGSDYTILTDLIRTTVAEALKVTGPMYRAEDARIARRGEFAKTVLAMIENGTYQTATIQDTTIQNGKPVILEKQILVLDDNGKPVLEKESPLKKYGITVEQFSIKKYKFDPKTDTLMMKKKDAEQTMVVSKAKADKAKQDAITAVEEGKAKIAKAEAEELEAKIREVTQAQKEKEVGVLKAEKERDIEKLNADKAKEIAKRIIAEGRAQAEANRLKVKAGLTPQERAEWKYKTETKVAEYKWEGISKVKFPETMVIGGDGKGQKVDPFMAMGLESLSNIKSKK